MNKHSILSCALTAALIATGGTALAGDTFGTKPLPAKATVGSLGQDQVTFSRFIVTYRDGSVQRTSQAAATRSFSNALSRAGVASARAGVAASSARHVRRLATGSELFQVSGRGLDRSAAEALMRSIAADPNVASVYPDGIVRAVRDQRAPTGLLAQAFLPNDPMFAKYQWHFMTPDGTPTQAGLANNGGSNATEAWDLADGHGVVIAVVDTGITKHPDLDTSLADAGYDFISTAYFSGRATDGRVAGAWDQGDWTNEAPWINDENCVNGNNPARPSSWHGTNVAAVSGAEITNNGVGMAGIANKAKVLPIRALGHCGGFDSDINDAIVWAAGGDVAGVPRNQNPAHIINLSLGGPRACAADSPQGQAIKKAIDLGAIVVAAAGNSNADVSGFSPAGCPGVITVASNGYTSRRAFYSNYGSRIDISAPGGGGYPNDGNSGSPIQDGFIWSALNNGTKGPEEISQANAYYAGMAGTSQAAPHVAGIVALMQGARLDAGLPLLDTDGIKAMLKKTATPFTVAPEAAKPIGPGIVNAGAAVKAALAPPCTGEDCAPDAIPLQNGVLVRGLAGGELLYSFEATAGKVLSFMSVGGGGNLDMYVSFDVEPTAANAQFKSTRAGNNETVRVTKAKAGTYYVKLVGNPQFTGAMLQARQ